MCGRPPGFGAYTGQWDELRESPRTVKCHFESEVVSDFGVVEDVVEAWDTREREVIVSTVAQRKQEGTETGRTGTGICRKGVKNETTRGRGSVRRRGSFGRDLGTRPDPHRRSRSVELTLVAGPRKSGTGWARRPGWTPSRREGGRHFHQETPTGHGTSRPKNETMEDGRDDHGSVHFSCTDRGDHPGRTWRSL